MLSDKRRIAIFASGTGTNTLAIYEFFKNNPLVEIALIASNNPHAGILSNPKVSEIPKWVFTRLEWEDEYRSLEKLSKLNIDLVVLAGFMWLVPEHIVRAYKDRIINIHPALLPAYGGKGMYGMHVHQAVLDAGENESGITIHRVNEKYDEGAIIFQATCDIKNCKSAEEIADRIHELEHFYYPRIILQLLFQTN